MTNYHYLDPTAEESASSLSVTELSQRVSQANDLFAWYSCAQELASLPYSRSAERLGSKIREALQAWRMSQELADAYPLPSAMAERWRALEAAWRALAQTYARWMMSGESRVEMRSATEALFCLRQIVLLCGLAHWPVPEGLWLDVHWIYSSNLELGAVQQRIRRSFLRHRFRTTIEWEYIQTVLLGMTDLFSLLPQEVLALDSLGEKWVAMVKLHSDDQAGWGIDEDSDVPVDWRTTGEGLRLDLTDLMEFLDSQHDLVGSLGRYEWIEQPTDTVSSALLDHWRKIWTHADAEDQGDVDLDQAEVEIGLEAVFGRLQGGSPSAASVIVADSERVLSGCEAVQVGDLLGLFGHEDGSPDGLAVISRLWWDDGEEFVVQVRLHKLEGEVFPVGVQPLYRGEQPCAYQRGLLLNTPDHMMLILSVQPLDEGAIVRILSGNKMYPVRLLSHDTFARGLLGCVCESAAGQFQK